jgi:poly(3-hydroxybutyrate) depolymerase
MVDPNPPIMTSGDPVIPQVTADCPSFQSGSFSFQGLSGEMEVGAMGGTPGPLLFYWHGTGGSAGGFRSPFAGIGSGNIQKITSQGGIIFAVQGATGSGDATCSGTAVFDGDFSVIDQVVACAVRDHNIDPRRIYATGCSAGGLQSGCMAARRQGYVAAVAPNSGGVVFPMPFDGAMPVPASMTMHGGTGDNVGINFGDSSRTFNDAVTGAGGFAVDCNHMSGHCGAPGDLYDAAIDFLLAHPYGVDPEPYASGLPAGVPGYCEIY